MDDKCSNCRFFRTANADNDDHRIIAAGGACHKHAPQPLIDGSGTGWADWDWPAMHPDDWCGEHERTIEE